MVSIRVLGPMWAEVGGVAADLGGPRQRGVLAMLLASRGDVVSVDRMIDDLWRGEPPPRAIASLQAYISNLRRALEPDRPPRSAARILISAPPGYAVRLDPGAVDAWLFADRLTQARHEADPVRALRLLDEALALWGGRAYAEFADEEWARAETARLDELQRSGRELQAALTLRTAAPGAAIPLAESITLQHPLHEEGWRLLALALWGAGRPADALAALRRARATLADELGLDPGPALVELESAILAQRTELLPTTTSPLTPARQEGVLPDQKAPERTPSWPGEVFVGRGAELDALGRAAAVARTEGAVALVSGEAGSGKSSLVRRLRDDLRTDGWLVVAGRCPETDGAPAAWAWTEALRGLAERVPPAEHAEAVANLLGDVPGAAERDASLGRFRMHQGVIGWLRAAAALAPTAVILDDLHGADAETLALLATAGRELAGVAVLLVAVYRAAEAGPAPAALTESLAVLAGRSPTRVQLGGLSTEDVSTLVTTVVGSSVDSSTLVALAERTGGNPFYVKESARLLASEGALVATSEVPEGVRDVLRRRFARLPAPAVSVLRLAAVVGRESDVDVLVGAADVDEAGVLDALEAGLFSGLLTEPAPGRIRFVHALVRDTLYSDLPGLRRTRWHARVAGELKRLRPADLTGLAHHYAHSASPETARLAVTYSIRAAEAAERRYAADACVALLRQASASLDHVADATDDERVDVLGRLLRAEIRAGQIGAARQTRDCAVDVAERAGRPDLLLAAYSAWTEPTPWLVRPYGTIDERAVGHLTTLLDGALDPAVRCRLIAGLVGELEGVGDPRMVGLADQAAALAADSDDPWLKGLALTTRTRDQAAAVDSAVWTELADQLDALGPADELVPYRWSSVHLRAKAAGAAGDVTGLRQHIERAAEIAETYRMAEAMSVTATSFAAVAHIRGDFEDARRRYVDATEAMTRHGSLHGDIFREFALVTVGFSQPDITGLEPTLRDLYKQAGPAAADALAVVLAAKGDREEAGRLLDLAPPAQLDYFWVLFVTIRVMGMTALGRREGADRLYAALEPYRGQIAGIGTVSVVMRPVAHTLGELALLLGDPDRARRDFEQALAVARRWDSPHWERDSRSRLAEI